jgi:multicomponent Na+:H+ antiporter subunit C
MLAAAIIGLLILVGIGGMILSDNLIKKVMALSILNSALVILFVWAGSLRGSEAPILLAGVRDIVDPLPQAVMLTAIVIGICVTAVALAVVLRIYARWSTVSRKELERRARRSDE